MLKACSYGLQLYLQDSLTRPARSPNLKNGVCLRRFRKGDLSIPLVTSKKTIVLESLLIANLLPGFFGNTAY